MPEISPIAAGLAVALVMLGFVLGWFLRSRRVKREKAAIHANWQEQIGARQQEHDRLAEQNRSLMEQISQYRASKKDVDVRAQELSELLNETTERRDELERELRSAQSNLAVAIRQRDQLKRDSGNGAGRSEVLKEKDEKIFRLSRELESWQNRLPPLLDKYRSRDLEAQQLEVELDRANARIAALESSAPRSATTRIEPVDDASLAASLDASNEQFDEGASVRVEAVVSDAAPAADRNSTGGAPEPEDTRSESRLEERAVDFDFGPVDQRDQAPVEATTSERSLVEVFHADGTVDDVDELLEAGDPPAIDAEALADDAAVCRAPPAIGHSRDDLQQIKGVGPAIEKTLNDLGYYSFDQIAHMSEGDIDRVARKLRGFRSRVYREDWIGQAQTLHQEKAGQPH